MNLLSGFDSLITRLHDHIENYGNDLELKIENIRQLIKLEKERALKDSTVSKDKNNRLNIPSWKLRTLVNLGWMQEERARQSITNFKTAMLNNLDIEPTAIQEKHFTPIRRTVKNYFETMCGILESCSDAIADYLMETRRTQPTGIIIYDEAVATTITLLERLQDGITIHEYIQTVNRLMTLAKRIEAKMIEKRNYMTDRLAYRGIGIKSFNL